MSLASALSSQSLSPIPSHANVFLAEANRFPALKLEAEEHGYLWVGMKPPEPEQRGRLGSFIEAQIEQVLVARGAVARSSRTVDLDDSIKELLYRARLIEQRGIAVGIPSLANIVDGRGALDPNDWQSLGQWFDETADAGFTLAIDDSNLALGVYAEPISLNSMLRPLLEATPTPTPGPALSEPEALSDEELGLEAVGELVGASESAMVAMNDDLVALDSAPEAEQEEALSELSVVPPEADWEAISELSVVPSESEALLAEASLESEPFTTLPGDELSELGLSDAPSMNIAELVAAIQSTPLPPMETEQRREAVECPTTRLDEALRHPTDDAWLDEPMGAAPSEQPVFDEEIEEWQEDDLEAEDADAAQGIVEIQAELGAGDTAQSVSEADASEDEDPFNVVAREKWPVWCGELQATRGPRSLSAVERTFVTSYMPLSEAVARGITGHEAPQALSSFRDSFAESYASAFHTLLKRNKRPPMVLDVPAITRRLAKAAGANSVHTILVEGMRFDVGMRVETRMKELLGDKARLIERRLLWSSLPTDSATQLRALGWSDATDAEDPKSDRGKGFVLHSIAGTRGETLRLRGVLSELDCPGAPLVERLNQVSDSVSHALVRHLRTLPSRALVVIFGDHGFVLNSLADGTCAARFGGATPEEVLVPTYGWLVGNNV